MSVNRNIRGMFGTVSIAATSALVVLSSLLVAQYVSLEFPRVPSDRQCSISADSPHARAERFDTEGLQWIAPAGTVVILPSSGRASGTLTLPLLPTIRIKGFHFSRPPPTR